MGKFCICTFVEDRTRKIQDGENSQYGVRVAAKVHAELRRLGGVKPPREFVLVDRAAIGLGSVFMRLNAEINWHQMFEQLIENFQVDKLLERQTKVLKSGQLI